jgi:hypothetical protein
MADLLDTIDGKPAEPAAPVSLNTAHARAMLHKRYPPPEWAMLEEVAPATGGGTRYADGIAVNLWQSRGHAVHGFEIKVSRSDWLRELKQPEKAEPLYRHCDHWWIVAPRGVVKDGELPPTWGLLELRESGLVQTVAAPRLEPVPLTRAFFASLMRRGHEQLEAMAGRRHHQALIDARAEMDRTIEQRVKYLTRNHEALAARVAKFEAETGMPLNEYAGPPVELIKLAQRLQPLSGYSSLQPLRRLAHLADELAKASATVREAIAETGLADEKAESR